MNTFKIASCTVTYDEDYNAIDGNPQRIGFLSEAADELSKKNVDLFVLPAGYLFSTHNGIKTLQIKMGKLSTATGIDLLIGVDIEAKNNNPKIENMIKRGKLPFFTIFASRNSSKIWRQRSTDSNNQYFASDKDCQEERIVRASPRIESIICGDIFNEKIRRGLINREVAIAIDQGHTAAGYRVFVSMKKLADQGITSLCSVHANVHGAVKYCYERNSGKRYSSRKSDIIIGEKPRLEIKIWEFDLTGKIVTG